MHIGQCEICFSILLVKKIADALDSVIPSLLEYGKHSDELTSAAQTIHQWDREKVLTTLDRLKLLVESFDAESLDIATELTRVANLKPFDKVLKQLCAALENFDFEAAENFVDKLQEEVVEELSVKTGNE